ncbi:tRNA dihydrouridine(20/20a) synthase DusA [Pseudahrensia aquimaris]|uniref:tRNA-dihydrouridine(20/20a) synthase n=1 Tax=Pseudahrensia aquimaris TaxID=744461 RepID=A0ABW3FL81_9HYPH
MKKCIKYLPQHADITEKDEQFDAPRFAVAPMMDWTDRHCRFFHRQLTQHALLYTEMVVADALVHGDVDRHLMFDRDVEQPVALQIGGSEPEKLAHSARLGAQYGYDEINLNVGCPSDRVQSGAFGACLMREPELVARCVEAMKGAVDIPVTVKCRIGVDDQDSQVALDDFVGRVFEAGCDGLWVHARKAWLKGLSPKENRDVPPLDYDRVVRLKADWPNRFIGINGGIVDLETAARLAQQLDGVMLGRTAYQNPALLADVDTVFYGEKPSLPNMDKVRDAMIGYAHQHMDGGGRLHHVTRHMIGLFQGQPGARRFRQIMTVDASKPGAGPQVIADAFAAITQAKRRDAA